MSDSVVFQGWQPAWSTSRQRRTACVSEVGLFFAKQDGRTVDVASGVAGVTGPESKIFFSAGPGIQGESSGLQPEACIQNDGSS
jgi:hypothetical protein